MMNVKCTRIIAGHTSVVICTSSPPHGLLTCIEEVTVFFAESPGADVGEHSPCRELVVCILKHCAHFPKCHESRLFHFQDSQKVWKFNSCQNPFLELPLASSQQHNQMYDSNNLPNDSCKILILAGRAGLSSHVPGNQPSCRGARPHLLLSRFLCSSQTLLLASERTHRQARRSPAGSLLKPLLHCKIFA